MKSVVPVVVRAIPGYTSAAADTPKDALADYFGALGYPLQFRADKALPDDPTDHPDEVTAFCATQEPQGSLPWPGVLVVGDMSVDGPGTNGVLLDTDRRGVCAVFANSFGYVNGSSEDRFEIYVHEIGHMLNLAHSDAGEKLATAMDQWDARSAVYDRSAVWKRVTQQGSSLQISMLKPFYGFGNKHPIGLPMSARCCQWLATQAVGDVLPWSGDFKDQSDQGSHDAAFGLVECELEVFGAGMVAQPVDLQVRVSLAPGQDGVDLPEAIDVRSGLIEIHVTAPNGTRRKYRSKSQTCGTSRKHLQRSFAIRRNYSLIADKAGLLFPEPGTYLIEAVLPTLGARSGTVHFEVAPAAGVFGHPDFQAFLAKDLPAGASTAWTAVDQMLRSGELAPATKGFLKSRAAARGHGAFSALDELRRDAAPRIQERDMLLRVIRLSRLGSVDPRRLLRVIDEAEEVFRATDGSNPSIQYLEHVRRRTTERHGGKKAS